MARDTTDPLSGSPTRGPVALTYSGPVTEGPDVLGGRRPSVAVVLLTYRPDTAGFDACLASVLASPATTGSSSSTTASRSTGPPSIGSSGPAGSRHRRPRDHGGEPGLRRGDERGDHPRPRARRDAVAVLNDDTVVEPAGSTP